MEADVLSPVVTRPAHVPIEAVYDFDMYRDPGLLRDPHERIREMLREAPPVFWTPRNQGHWMVIGHKENYIVSRDSESFTSSMLTGERAAAMLAGVPKDFGHIPKATPINMDPPLHTIYRAPLQAAFSPKAMLARKESVRALANKLIDAVIDQGQCDFIPDIAEPLPVQVFLTMLGLPLERAAELRALVLVFMAPASSIMDIIFSMRKVADEMKGEIEARRTDPKDDLISLLWRSEIEGKPMTFELMEDYAVLLFIAGLEHGDQRHGLRHPPSRTETPAFQNELRANPKTHVVEAAEELLRRYTFYRPDPPCGQGYRAVAGWTLKGR